MKATLDHIGIAVANLGDALSFYRDALGTPRVVARGFQPRRKTVRRIARRPNSSASLQFHI